MGRYAYTTYRAYRSGKLAWNAWKLADIADDDLEEFGEGYRAAATQALRESQKESQSSMDAAGTPGWQDEGVQIETGRVSVHSTPTHDDSRPKVNSTPVAESSKPRDKGFDTYEEPDARIFTSDRKDNCSKGESSVWKGFQPYKGATKTNDLGGRKQEYYEWDFTHNDIEVYDSKFKHKGSMDPVTGKIYKSAVKARDAKR